MAAAFGSSASSMSSRLTAPMPTACAFLRRALLFISSSSARTRDSCGVVGVAGEGGVMGSL